MPGTSNGDGLGAEGQPGGERLRPLALERHADLRPEGVRVVELHHAGPRPVPGRWTGVPVHRDDVVAATGQRTAEEQAGGAGSDDRDSHEHASSRACGASSAVSVFSCATRVNAIDRHSADLAAGQPHLLDVQPGLELAQHDVVDALLVAQPDHGGPLAGEQGEPQRGVLLLVAQHRLVVVVDAGVHDVQVLLVLAAGPLDHLGVGAELGGHLGQRRQRRLGGLGLGEPELLVDRGVRGSRAHRTTAGRTSAWSRVTAMTPAVTKTIRSRPGNGSPDATVSGTASAAASETAPRKPATPLTTRPRGPTRRSRCCGRRSSARITYGMVNSQAKRTPMTTAETTATANRARVRSMLVSPRTDDWTSSPTSTKRAPLSR